MQRRLSKRLLARGASTMRSNPPGHERIRRLGSDSVLHPGSCGLLCGPCKWRVSWSERPIEAHRFDHDPPVYPSSKVVLPCERGSHESPCSGTRLALRFSSLGRHAERPPAQSFIPQGLRLSLPLAGSSQPCPAPRVGSHCQPQQLSQFT